MSRLEQLRSREVLFEHLHPALSFDLSYSIEYQSWNNCLVVDLDRIRFIVDIEVEAVFLKWVPTNLCQQTLLNFRVGQMFLGLVVASTSQVCRHDFLNMLLGRKFAFHYLNL